MPLCIIYSVTALRRSTIPKVLYSEGPVFQKSYVPKLRGSMFRRFYVPQVLCSEKKSKVLYSDGSIFRRFYVPQNWKVLYSDGSMFRYFRLCIPLRVHGIRVGTTTHAVDGHMHTGLNLFYRANHVFPEWHHNCVGSIILCGCVENKLGVITEYLVSLWCHIRHHLPYSTGHFQCIAYRALCQFPINQYPMNIVSSRAAALVPHPLPGYSAISVTPLCNSIVVMRPGRQEQTLRNYD